VKIGIVGVGVVGSTTAHTFEVHGHDVRRCDPHQGYDEDPTADVIFVCVWDQGDMSNVCKVVDLWQDSCSVMVIKTTLMPGTTDRLIRKHGDHICFCPEFLTEATARADSMEPDKIVIGSSIPQPLLDELFDPFCCDKTYVSPTEAELLKLATNSFYAIKVGFANELYEICELYGADYEAVREGMEQDRHIAPNHLDVHHAGYRGFGGKCLPKDIAMLLRSAWAKDAEVGIMEAAVNENHCRNGER